MVGLFKDACAAPIYRAIFDPAKAAFNTFDGPASGRRQCAHARPVGPSPGSVGEPTHVAATMDSVALRNDFSAGDEPVPGRRQCAYLPGRQGGRRSSPKRRRGPLIRKDAR